jgi:Holliday junction DNA helicase RuvA
MIAALHGKLLEKDANSVVIDVGGVGYEVTIPLSTFYLLGDIGTDVDLRIHTYVREDALQLFGFSSASDRSLFLRLIAVSGIGPKLAVSMLSAMGSEEIVTAISTDNLAALTSIPGIGKKTAERMVIELRDKIADLASAASAAAAGANGGASAAESAEALDDALSALVNLGYQQKAADKALKKAVQEGTELSVQKLLKRGLQILARN